MYQDGRSSFAQVFSVRSRHFKFLRPLIFTTFLIYGFSLAALGQETGPSAPEDFIAAPPPLKIMVKEEKEQLEAARDIKERTKLALDLMEGRLRKAEEMDTQNKFVEMYDELGRFHALMDYTFKFLQSNDTGRGKVLNNFKRFEIGIRAYAPRIEVVRRNLPVKYEAYLRSLLEQLRDTRGKAVEAFFDDTVIPQAVNKP